MKFFSDAGMQDWEGSEDPLYSQMRANLLVLNYPATLRQPTAWGCFMAKLLVKRFYLMVGRSEDVSPHLLAWASDL